MIKLSAHFACLFLVLGLFNNASAQNFVLDTVIKTRINEDYNDFTAFQVWGDSLLFYVLKAQDSSSVLHLTKLHPKQGKEVYPIAKTLAFPRFITKHEEGFLIANTQSALSINLDSKSAPELRNLNKDLFRQTYANPHMAVSLETYPDFFWPKQRLEFRSGSNVLDLEEKHAVPFDFPHFFARVGQLIDFHSSGLFYCNTLDYSCYLYNFETKESELLIKDSLNGPLTNDSIEMFREEIFSGSQQPKYWIPKLQEFDEKVYRITKVFYNEDLILIFKRAPGSKFDYRLLDIYTKVDTTWKLERENVLAERWPKGELSYSNPPIEIMDSYPAVLFQGKLYILSKKDYTEGLKEGISVEEFKNKQNEYYEDHENYYSIFVYSIP